jgi:arylsulfatase A-like enzyme
MTRKNIILITIDDGGSYWRFRDAFGERLQTPNLDRICAASTAFTSAYCQAPICGPSRNSLMSGLAPHQTGLLDNYTNLFNVLRPEQLWQYRLKQAGFYCSTAGKVHHSFSPIAPKFHNTLYSHPPKRLTLGPPRTVPVKRYGGLTGGAGTTETEHDPLYYDHQSATDAVEFLQNYDNDAPFYREIGFHHPHLPLKTPARFKDMYDEDAFVQPADWAKGFETTPYPDQFMIENIDSRDLSHWRKSVRNYFSAYTHVDSHIGRVWDALQASPHAKDTILLITSDHGFHLGDKNRMRKFTLWEESCRVPLIIHAPGVPAREIKDPVALLDVGPTILDYAGCPPLHGAPGKSLKAQMDGASDPGRAVPTFLFGNSSMRKGPYRITLYENGDSEFHDVDKDPWLTRNLAGKHPDYDQMRRELVTVCADHGLVLGDGLQSAVGNFGAVGTLDEVQADPQPQPPGKRVHFSTLLKDGAAPLPDGYSKMNYGADTGGDLHEFKAYGNSADNEFLFPGSFNRFKLSFYPGPGENLVIAQNDDMFVYCGSGDTTIRSGNARAVIYGGTGFDVMYTGKGQTWLHGGAGPANINAGAGPTEMISGTGHNTLTAGPGPTRITLDGGCNEVLLQGEHLYLKILRTGLPQIIRGFRGGTIDITDWAPTGSITLRTQGKDLVLSSTTEQVVFQKNRVDDLRPFITGAPLT